MRDAQRSFPLLLGGEGQGEVGVGNDRCSERPHLIRLAALGTFPAPPAEKERLNYRFLSLSGFWISRINGIRATMTSAMYWKSCR